MAKQVARSTRSRMAALLRQQRDFMAQKGGDQAGYRETYGVLTDAEADAIYQADIVVLAQLRKALDGVIWPNPR